MQQGTMQGGGMQGGAMQGMQGGGLPQQFQQQQQPQQQYNQANSTMGMQQQQQSLPQQQAQFSSMQSQQGTMQPAAGNQGQQEVVGAVLAGVVAPGAERVPDRVHRKRDVIQDRRADEETDGNQLGAARAQRRIRRREPLTEPVDLDGTLCRTDTLHEALLRLVAMDPAKLFRLPGWLAAARDSAARHRTSC